MNILATGRAEALFCSNLSVEAAVTRTEVADAIRVEVRAHGGVSGCASDVAWAYGDHPEGAAARMRWATRTVADVFPARRDVIWNKAAAA